MKEEVAVKASVMRIDGKCLVVGSRTFYNNKGIWEPVDKLPVGNAELLSLFDFLKEEIHYKDLLDKQMIDELIDGVAHRMN